MTPEEAKQFKSYVVTSKLSYFQGIVQALDSKLINVVEARTLLGIASPINPPKQTRPVTQEPA